MSDKMTPIPLEQLLHWILGEYRAQQSVFGMHQSLFFKKQGRPSVPLFAEDLETAVGPAAGPHTQMAQNIITAYLAGARFFELKTVQKLDQLEISKPCIDARDECYNIEWSQELSLEQSFDEYLKAWLLLPIFKNLFALSDSPENGFIFNMSVGYDLPGIKTAAMDQFINYMQDATLSSLFNQYKKDIKDFINTKKDELLAAGIRLQNIENTISAVTNISSRISGSVTLSTMHGCPPQEIEAIASYLLLEKKLHTYVKLNPTLLGYDFVSGQLNIQGFDYIQLDKNSFDHDLQYDDALGMIKRLQEKAQQAGKTFGIKLSNTLGVVNKADKLNDSSMYMSGRSLFPLTINLAAKLATDFAGQINISYSGGADQNNITDLLNCGIFPVTMVTDLLKPGGYQRLLPIVTQAEGVDFKVLNKGRIDFKRLHKLANKSARDKNYIKNSRAIESIKTSEKLTAFDCYMAPCQQACPIHQDVAQYIRLVEEGRYVEAVETILARNPLPHITGYICDHQCMNHCTRWDYDSPLLIRDLKLEAAQKGFDTYLERYKKNRLIRGNNIKAAIIGAGPAGLSAAYFLAKTGFNVTVFDKRDRAGGVVSSALPGFRLPAAAIEKDIDFIRDHGVTFRFDTDKDFSIDALKKDGYKYIFLAIGAGKSNRLQIPGMNGNLLEAIPFLEKFNCGEQQVSGKAVAVIGGGNSAMDAARAAVRCKNVEKVYIIYRRTKEFMPADLEEFDGAVKDGVIFRELLSPVAYIDGRLKCQLMKLAEKGSDGRRKVVAISDQFESIEIDSVILAIGEHVDYDLLQKNNLLNSSSKVLKADQASNETILKNVFIGGDALRGPATVVQAIADGRKTADAIIGKEKLTPTPAKDFDSFFDAEKRASDLVQKKGRVLPVVQSNLQQEASRCLGCSFSCDKCVDVCPNRANITIDVSGYADLFKDSHQIIHLDGLCNECGNCETFCPYQGAPYRDKPTLFWSEADFDSSRNDGFYFKRNGIATEKSVIKIRQNSAEKWVELDRAEMSCDPFWVLIKEIMKNYKYLLG